jgi:lantibiotic modifying enzyme
MTKRYGHAFSSLPIHRIGPASKFMEDFETVKRDFDGKDPTRTFEIHLKMRDLEEKGRSVVQYDFEEDAITLTR